MIRVLVALLVLLNVVLVAAYRAMPDEWKEGRASCLYRDAAAR